MSTSGIVNGNGSGQTGAGIYRADSVIDCVEVVKSFGDPLVLNGVTASVPRGEITVIMGPSGTGKSVLLRHIVGLLLPDSGDVLVEGKSVPHLGEEELLELRPNIGMLFQDGALFSSMTPSHTLPFPPPHHTRNS